MKPRTGVLHLRQSAGGGGGADTVVMEWLDLLDQDHYSAEVVYLRKTKHDIWPILQRLDEHDIAHTDYPGRRFFDLAQFRQVRRHLIRQNIGILHCHDSKADIYGWLLRKSLPKLKLAATLHNWISHSWRSGIYKRLDLLVLKRFDIITTPSVEVAREAAKAGVPGVQVLANGVNLKLWPSRPSPPLGNTPFTVGFASRLSREKGVSDFIAVAKEIVSQVPTARFHVAGEGPEGEHMRSLTEQTGLTNRFKFLGFLNEADMYDHYSTLDVLLHPSHVEALPMTLLEAAAVGVPVVATQVGDVDKLFEHGRSAFICRAGDVAAMAKALVILAGSPERAKKMSEEARSVVEAKYDMSKKIRILEQFYRQALEKASGRP